MLGEGERLESGLGWVASTVAMATLVAEVRESTRRVSELVSAVRSYTQMDRASRQDTDVREGLESTLIMLGHKLRGGVRVVRAYDDDLPRIEANPGELNQVWTNLVDNAVDAMDGSGTLRVTARAEDDAVVSRLRAPLEGVERLDLVRMLAGGAAEQRLADVPFDPEAGEVLVVPPASLLKSSAFVMHMRLVAVGEAGERAIADYTFNHAPS